MLFPQLPDRSGVFQQRLLVPDKLLNCCIARLSGSNLQPRRNVPMSSPW
jgi:hypothetical protein